MNESSRPGWAHPLWTPLHIATIVCLAVSQPLLDLIARHPEFLTALGIRGAAVAGLGLGIAWLPPLVLALPATLLLRRRTAGTGARFVAGSLLFLTLTLLGLGISSRVTEETWPAALASLVVAILGWTMYRKLAGFRFAASVLSIVLVLAPAVFFTSRGVSNRLSSTGESESAPPVADPQPVFILLFDELPGWLAMTPEFEIDAERFPNLANFASGSDFFPRAFASDASTIRSVPSLLAGVHLLDVRSPRMNSCNFFSRIDSSYDLTVNELVTDLAPATADSLGDSPGFVSITRDLVWIYLHWLLPAPMASTLPPVDGRWTGFGVGPEIDLSAQQPAVGPGVVEVTDVTVPRFGRFLRSIQSPGEGLPDFVFHHCYVPHFPWRLLPSGQTYSIADPPNEREGYFGDAWWALEGRVRKDLDSRVADVLLGRFLKQLKAKGQYESAWVIVLSDHGTAFTPGQISRPSDYVHLPVVLSVPLMIKRPGQTEPRRSDQFVELVDVAVTLSEELGFQLPCEPNGRNLYRSPHRTYDETLFSGLYDQPDGKLEEVETLLRHESLRHRIALGLEDPAAGEGVAKVRGEAPIRPRWTASSPYGLGPYGSLLGREVPDGESSLPYQLELEMVEPDVIVDPQASVLLAARLYGILHGAPDGEHVDLALAQGRRIISTTRSRNRVGDEFFSGLADPSLLRAGSLDLTAYALRGSPEEPEFFQLEVVGKSGRAREVLAGAGRVVLAQGGVHGFDLLKRAGGAGLREAGGELFVQSKGVDPRLFFELQPVDSTRIVVELDLTVFSNTEVQVWFQSEELPAFHMQQVRIAALETGRNREVIEIASDSDILNELRIDPGVGPGEFVIHSVVVRVAGSLSRRPRPLPRHLDE